LDAGGKRRLGVLARDRQGTVRSPSYAIETNDRDLFRADADGIDQRDDRAARQAALAGVARWGQTTKCLTAIDGRRASAGATRTVA
jgi:hypothetical protein